MVTVSSTLHKQGRLHWTDPNYERRAYDPMGAYCQSKLANVLFSAELGRRLAGTGVTTYALHPGVIRTDLARNTRETYGLGAHLVLKYVVGPFIKSPESGAQTTIFCCVDESLAGRTTDETL